MIPNVKRSSINKVKITLMEMTFLLYNPAIMESLLIIIAFIIVYILG